MLGLVATSQESASQTLGIDVRTLQRWVAAGCPGEKKRYVIREMIEWARANRWGNEDEVLLDSIEGGNDLKSRLLEEKVRKLSRENQLLEMKVDETNGTKVDISLVEGHLRRLSDMVRGQLEAVSKIHGREPVELLCQVFDEFDAQLNGGVLDRSGDAAQG